MDTLTRTTPAERISAPVQLPGPILVATDGTASADPAFVAARCIHERTGFPVQILSVLEPQPILIQSPASPVPVPSTEHVVLQLRTESVKRQVKKVDGEDSSWRLNVRFGRPAAEIARTAKRRHAELIITGMNRHGLIDRLLGNETPIHIAQLGDAPLLAASAGFTTLPKSVLIATDLFSPALDRLGDDSAARALLAEARTVYCIHVVPEIETWGPDNSYWNQAYGQAVQDAFARLKETLKLSRDVHLEMITPNGDAAREILDFAAFAQIQLIMVGRREATMFERRVNGGIAAKLLRGASCSVLLLPPPKHPLGRQGRPLLPGHTETLNSPHMWVGRLMDFNRRNKGRRASLEIDDLDIGAQTQLHDYPLLGVDFDGRSRKVDIMLGDSNGSPRHLRHSIPSPDSLSIVTGADGREVALRIGYAGGQALLTFDG